MEPQTEPRSNGARAALWLVVVAIVAAFWFAWNKQTPDTTIKVGAIFPLSGASAVYGEMAKKGIELALKGDSANITVVYEDSQFQSVPALSAYEKLKAE